MSGIVQQSLPSSEPVSLPYVKNFLKINTDQDDTLISALITAARSYCEDSTGLMLASRDFVEYRDGFPSMPYIPGYGLVPSISTGFPFQQNYPISLQSSWQMYKTPYEIHLLTWPVTEIDHITYIGSDGNPKDLSPGTDFIMDLVGKPARVVPLPSQVWPINLLYPNSVAIYYTAGFDPDPTATDDVKVTTNTPPNQIAETEFVSGIPQTLRLAICILVSHWYFNRDAAVAGQAASVPHSVDQLLQASRAYNFDIQTP